MNSCLFPIASPIKATRFSNKNSEASCLAQDLKNKALRNETYMVVVDVAAIVVCGYELRRALSTGHARIWPGGMVTRKGQPRK